MEVQKFKRGQIWWYTSSNNYDGHVQGGTRPVIIISNNIANGLEKCLIVVPCTTSDKTILPTNIIFNINNTRNTALCGNLMSINPEKLTEYVGTIDKILMNRIEKGIKVALGFEVYYNNIPSPTNPLPIEKQDGFIPVNVTTINYESPNKPLKAEEKITEINKIIENSIDEEKEPKVGRKPKMTDEEKHRFLNDYKNHDKDYMLKKYGIKDYKCLHQKVYMIRKEFGLGVRK